jgi:hypothetical protein
MKRTLCLLIAMSFFGGLMSAPLYAQDYMRSPFEEHSASTELYESYRANAEDPPGEFIILDAAIFRPFGIAAMGIGLAGAIISWPWAVTSNSGERVGRRLLQEPFQYTFCRPLGDIVDP